MTVLFVVYLFTLKGVSIFTALSFDPECSVTDFLRLLILSENAEVSRDQNAVEPRP